MEKELGSVHIIFARILTASHSCLTHCYDKLKYVIITFPYYSYMMFILMFDLTHVNTYHFKYLFTINICHFFLFVLLCTIPVISFSFILLL